MDPFSSVKYYGQKTSCISFGVPATHGGGGLDINLYPARNNRERHERFSVATVDRNKAKKDSK